jgi:hypothetical protein
MVRVIAAGGRIGATVWSASEESPFLHRETEMLATHGGGSQAGFSATEEQLQAWFVAGGLGDVAIERIVVEVDLPPVSVYVPEHLKALPWSVGFFDRTAEDQAAALVELDEGAREVPDLGWNPGPVQLLSRDRHRLTHPDRVAGHDADPEGPTSRSCSLSHTPS